MERINREQGSYAAMTQMQLRDSVPLFRIARLVFPVAVRKEEILRMLIR
jgi:hypothetical protein